MNSTVSGAFNIGTGVETDVNQLYRALTVAAGAGDAPLHGPARSGEQRRSVISPGRAARELNWTPQVALSEGLGRTFAFFKERFAQQH
jgi:UDP-glucose 4-epimerase